MNDSISTLGIRDIHLPSDVAWWPLASGWWLLMALGLFFIVLTYQKLKKRRALHAFKNDPKKLLSQAQKLLNKVDQISDNNGVIKEISVLLRRIAMSLYGREKVAGLTGKEWLVFLDETGETDSFYLGKGQVLVDQPYKEYTDYDRNELVKMTSEWLATQIQYEQETEQGCRRV